MELTGFVSFVTEKTDKSKKVDKQFFTQELGLHMKDEVNGQIYENFAKVQFNGDRCDVLIPINIGDKVKVEFSIKGSLQVKENTVGMPKNPKANDIYTNLQGINVVVIEKATIVEGSNVNTNANTNANKPTKPAIIPEGYVWDETKGLIADIPFG